MFGLCEGMKWAHLPAPGGLYDQDPALLEGFRYIFHVRAQHEADEEKKRDRQSNRTSGRPTPKGGRRG